MGIACTIYKSYRIRNYSHAPVVQLSPSDLNADFPVSACAWKFQRETSSFISFSLCFFFTGQCGHNIQAGDLCHSHMPSLTLSLFLCLHIVLILSLSDKEKNGKNGKRNKWMELPNEFKWVTQWLICHSVLLLLHMWDKSQVELNWINVVK